VSLGCAVTLLAEKPPKDFQDLMKSNGSIIDISLGTVRSSVGAGAGQEAGGSSLRRHIREKNYEGLVTDATTLRDNFTKIEAFWTQRKVADAINWSKAALKAANELEAAAKARDDAAVGVAANAVAATCRDCHLKHRVINLADGTFEIL
jgi:hypothetical protein